MFLPSTPLEMQQLGWDRLDIILVTGDAYIDSPFIGVSVIGRVLEQQGYRVGIIGQPDINSDQDILRLGVPRLFWGVSGGCIDSLVANRTAANKRRQQDDYTPGGENTYRPDRAVISYTNLIRRCCKEAAAPIVLGGIEASLRRLAHYDFWSNGIRRSILFDAKADFLLYGMAEKSVVALARYFEGPRNAADLQNIRGLCYPAKQVAEGCLELPSYVAVKADPEQFIQAFTLFYNNNDPLTARPLAQLQDTRWLIQNTPAELLTSEELDAVHELPYMLDLHPLHRPDGPVRALETIRFALTTHRGCYGECHFCAIAVHQGRTVQWRSRESLLREAVRLSKHPLFKGNISDVGGPTANMYGFECRKKLQQGVCNKKRCLYPAPCSQLPLDHGPQIELLQALRQIPGVKQVRVASGIRYDMILADKKSGRQYLRELIRHHIGGQLKIAPEHTEKQVLDAMGKPGKEVLLQFRDLFVSLVQKEKRDLFLTYYLIAAHPACTLNDMQNLRRFCREQLHVLPRQVQIFTPTPSTWSSLMYWTGKNPFTGKAIFCEKNGANRQRQKDILGIEKKS